MRTFYPIVHLRDDWKKGADLLVPRLSACPVPIITY